MQVFHYASRTLLKGATLFDERILCDNWVLFHGTSSVHEASIDRDGLEPRKYKVSKPEMMSVYNIFRSMNWRWESSLSSLQAYSFPDSTDRNGDVRAICLTADPAVAATYSGRVNAGGESAQMLFNCLRSLRRYLRDPQTRLAHLQGQWEEFEESRANGRKTPITIVRRGWLSDRLRELTPLYNRLVNIQREHRYGVIYALRFGARDLIRMTGSGTSTVIFRGRIQPERIVAKAMIVGEVKDLRQTGRFCPSLSLDETTLPGALSKLNSARTDMKTPKKYRDPWREATCDPDAGRDLVGSRTPDDLRAYLAASYRGFFDSIEGTNTAV